ncbi:hypothetical protein [Microbacterium azadirachtae]|uniref:Uncharacterized protein n=1 Tax=Microbacterium azadirachtae TaxID=582680 RepID=A0A0F0LGS2_9MICO|nr:hypothetical protein [Microbacterium azadirachtae]KJL32432.1 hypothetical protein RL72_00174 [Microbacterium azadirachtae]UXW86067.1 hypothetical protein NFX31_00565 [Microbacterium azadirachtae]SDL64168.1 hypothetical protein SAMN04488593_1430 [Microbacterium azadirachtae]SEF93390.1 hypothetical protein SAMN04488594_1417 [Microbacterium azadirachtae]SEF95838.1 hypothetical protein SAMN04488592_1427 [Microbacterium azadirachtae]
MSGTDELYPPAQYGWGWILLAIGVLVLLAAAAWLVVVLTRPRRAVAFTAPAAAPMLAADVATVLRQEYLGTIAQIEADYRAGLLDARRANLDLSRTVRGFVNEYSGIEAPVLALDDLVRLGVHPALIDAIGRNYYPSIFRRTAPVDPLVGAEAARTVVTTWY